MTPLALCASCSRHFRRADAACPFCGGATTAPARRFAPIPAGSARSRRYAVRAVLLAGATASCAGGTNDEGAHDGGGPPDAATAMGGAGGSGGVGQADGGGAGRSNAGGSSGAGGTGVGGGLLVPGRACPGYAERDPAVAPVCRTAADCPPSAGQTAYCRPAPPPVTGPCDQIPQFSECVTSADCGPDWECRSFQCDLRACVLTVPCSEQNCTGTRHCVGGTCTPKFCDEPGAAPCPDGYECRTDLPSTPQCAPRSCTNGYRCPPPLECSGGFTVEVHGCIGTPCQQDADCACGYCVSTQCAPQAGICNYQILMMPYGCVWPDEELV